MNRSIWVRRAATPVASPPLLSNLVPVELQDALSAAGVWRTECLVKTIRPDELGFLFVRTLDEID